jgi:hypothetical protein
MLASSEIPTKYFMKEIPIVYELFIQDQGIRRTAERSNKSV